MSSIITSSARPTAAAWMTSLQASGIIMKKRVTSGWVTVTGPPCAMWSA